MVSVGRWTSTTEHFEMVFASFMGSDLIEKENVLKYLCSSTNKEYLFVIVCYYFFRFK